MQRSILEQAFVRSASGRHDRTSRRSAALNAEISLLREKKKQADESIKRELADAKKLRACLAADELVIPAALDSFTEENADRYASKQVNAEHAIRNIQETLVNLGETFSREQILLDEQVAQLKAESSQLENEIRKLRTGDRDASYETESPQAAHLRHILRAELNLGADDVKYLCDEPTAVLRRDLSLW